uniref:Uncharacterized protein n=1 Tax=Acrobeloides nanus TaxID=290746 RepID=A0A914E1Y8_9BILA
MCRKIVQNVEFIREKKTVEETRIIRECAYTDEKLDGKKRTGNKGIILYLYQCQNENNEPCNASNALSYSIMSVVASLFCFILRSQI